VISLSIPNIITIALICLLSVAAAKFGLNAMGQNAAWL
jgi:hypothetical protein